MCTCSTLHCEGEGGERSPPSEGEREGWHWPDTAPGGAEPGGIDLLVITVLVVLDIMLGL